MRRYSPLIVLALLILAALLFRSSDDTPPVGPEPSPPLAEQVSPLPRDSAQLSNLTLADPDSASLSKTISEPVQPAEPPAESLGSIAGRVIDADGVPVEAAKVSLKRAFPIEGTPPGPYRSYGRYTYNTGASDVTTDRDGGFSFVDLESANYSVSAEGDGYAAVKGTFILLEPGEQRTGVEIQVGIGGFIAGEVVDRRSRPIPDAYVTVAERIRGYPRTQARSDTEGRFVVRGLSDTQYTVRVGAEGYTTVSRGDLELGDRDARFVLAPRGTLSIFVTDARTGEPVQKFFGKLPLDTLRARNQRMKSSTLDRGPGELVESVNGEWRIGDLERGPYALSIMARGYVPHAQSGFLIAPEITDEGVRRIDVRLDPGVRVFGRTVDSRGHPIAGARVRISGLSTMIQVAPGTDSPTALSFSADPFMISAEGEILDWQERCVSDREGTFELVGLSPGELHLTIEHPEYRDHPLTLPTESATEIDCGELTLLSGATVEGVVHLPEGRILGGRRIELFRAENHMFPYRTAPLGANGEYRFSGLDAGKYALHIQLRQSNPRRKLTAVEKFEIEDQQTLHFDLSPE